MHHSQTSHSHHRHPILLRSAAVRQGDAAEHGAAGRQGPARSGQRLVGPAQRAVAIGPRAGPGPRGWPTHHHHHFLFVCFKHTCLALVGLRIGGSYAKTLFFPQLTFQKSYFSFVSRTCTRSPPTSELENGSVFGILHFRCGLKTELIIL